uniref:TEP1-F n=1 Tax=Anopheles epiroticus TaxID=199890 RepID=A0A182P1U3_9DIPT
MPWYVRMLVLITGLGCSAGVLIVGPKYVRANHEYTMAISNFNQETSKVSLMLRMDGQSENGTKVLSIAQQVDVRKFQNRIVTLTIPTIASPIDIKLTIDGLRGFSFHDEVNLEYPTKSLSGLIQINKPVFKPGDTVKFRVIVLDTELKPPVGVKSIHVTISDPQDNVIRRWSTAKLYIGVFESDLQIAPTPMLGIWYISVKVEGEELVTKTFEVKEYVLSSFDLQVMPTAIPLEEHQALNLTIAANYHFGKPVKGVAKVELYLEDDKLDQKRELEMFGMGQVYLRFNEELELYDDQRDVQVKVTFIELFTNRTIVKEQSIAIYKYLYRAVLTKESPQFHPGIPFKCDLKLSFHDGSPVRNVPFLVKIDGEGIEHEQTYTSKRDGTISLTIHPTESTEIIDIDVSTAQQLSDRYQQL